MAKRGHPLLLGSSLATPRTWIADVRRSTSQQLVIDGVRPAGKLGDGDRGALIFPDLEIEGTETQLKMRGNGFDPDVVRASLLLFDRLDYPMNSIMGVGPEQPEGLEQWDGLQNTWVALSGAVGASIFETTLLAAFESLDGREAGKWSVSRAASGLALPATAFRGKDGFRIKLENLLLIPDRQVPYEDVLKFREDHHPELLALRHHLDEMALEVARDGFGGLAETVALEKFMKSLDDYHAAMRPKNFLKRITSLEVSFSVNEAIKAGFGTIALAANSPSATLAEYLATFGGVIAVDKALSLKRNCPVPFAYEYLFRAGKEL